VGGAPSPALASKCQLNTASLNSYCGGVDNCVEEEGVLPITVCTTVDGVCVGDTANKMTGGICEPMDKEECDAEPASYICEWK